jgi:hypothetical protein
MNKELSNRTKASEEQIVYAKILSYGTLIGLPILAIIFFIYISGIAAPLIPINELPNYWAMNVSDYMRNANLPQGWGWISLIKHGDFMNFIGITMLSGLTILCYMAILPILIRKKDTPYIIIAILEIAVLVFAASGILTAVGH